MAICQPNSGDLSSSGITLPGKPTCSAAASAAFGMTRRRMPSRLKFWFSIQYAATDTHSADDSMAAKPMRMEPALVPGKPATSDHRPAPCSSQAAAVKPEIRTARRDGSTAQRRYSAMAAKSKEVCMSFSLHHRSVDGCHAQLVVVMALLFFHHQLAQFAL